MTLLSHHAADLLARLRRDRDPSASDLIRLHAMLFAGDLIHVDEIGLTLRADAARGWDLPPGVTMTPEHKDAA